MVHRRSVLLALLVLVLALFLPSPSTAPGSGPPFVEGEVLLKFLPEASAADRDHLRVELMAETVHRFQSGAEHWRLGPGVSVEQALARLSGSPLLAYVEPNYILSVDVIPDDPRLPELWGMINTGQTGGTPDADIDADLAWGVSTGSPSVLVGVIDTGMDYNHPDLAANVWTNPGEIPDNGIDDDDNGYIDDVRGWDWVNDDNDPFDDHGHGTHVSGTIGAVGNNAVGVVGVAWNVKIVPLKFLSASGSGSTTDAVLAVEYANSIGADLTSNSWGGGGYSQSLYDVIAASGAQEIAFVAAAGNESSNTDVSPHYPSSYDLPNIIAVAATDHNDQKASFSNWGPTTVDLAAPGVAILSTFPGNSYGSLQGTSMATPHVAGACALIRSVSPDIPVAQLKTVLLNSVDPIASMDGLVVSNGRLNAFFAIAEPDDVPPGPVVDLAAVEPGSNTMGLGWTATGDDGDVGTATYYEMRYSTSPIDDANFSAATRAGGEPVPEPAGTPQQMEVKNLEASTYYYFAIKAFDEWGNQGPVSNLAASMTLPPPTAEAIPMSIEEALFTGEMADHVVTLSNVGVGTLDFTIPPPAVGEPQAQAEPLELGKDEADPRQGDPIVENSGGPDTFGHRWVDSDEPGGPAFAWLEISETGTPVNLTGDDATSGPIDLGFNFPFYGTFFDQVRICTNGFISFTSTSSAYSNQPLPNSAAPENMVAALWDDLNPKSINRTFFQSFGTRAVVQWNAIERYEGAGAYTFQIILDQSGAITLQYLTLTGDVAQSTIGIQDASKTVGLQVAFNQAYLHDNLAVRIAAIPQWLTAGPTSGRLHSGESIPISVHIDASGLEGGLYPGAVNILTNDPNQPVIPVAVSLQVTGAPDIAVQPTAIAYGDRFVSNPHTSSLIVANDGTDVLNVFDIVGSDAVLSATPTAFDVPPHGSQNVTVTWAPDALGAFDGSLTIQSNDAADPSLVVPVTGKAIPAPVMIVDPSSFDETLFSGNQLVRTLQVTNTGGSDLDVTAAADQGAEGTGLIYAPDAGAAGAGGPDAFDYRWKDSDESGGPAFDWIDIRDTGTQISFSSSDDALSAAIDMGMTFPFYGNNFSQVKVGTNGFLTLSTDETSTRLTNYNLPSTSAAKNMLALFWDDLHLRSGNVKYLFDGTRFIVQYTNVEKYSPSGNPLTFQVQLYPNGKIVYQYLAMAGTLNSATIGIQDGTKTIGLPVVYNANYVHDDLAVQISRVPDWLTVSPNRAVVPPGESFDFSVTFDSNQRNGGELSGAIVLMTNIPNQEEERVPAVLHVIGAPIVGLVPESYDFGTKYTDYSHLTTFQVLNNGTDVLNVADVFTTNPNLYVEVPIGGENSPQAGFPLPPGGARLFNLRWNPLVAGPLVAEVHVLSDDPLTPDAVMPVTGAAIDPPVAVWSPDHFSETLLSGEVVHRTLRLENQGLSDLTFDTMITLDSGASVPIYEPLELKKYDDDPREGVLGAGGPDVYGYIWRDSDQEGGPNFDWQEIGGIGTPITNLNGDDQNSGAIPLGFSFPFYGRSFDSVRVVTNGWLSFTNTTTDLSNDPLPNTAAPENLLAVFWDDLHFRSQNRTSYYADGEKFIVQYTNVDRFSSSTPSDLTFQVILYPSGQIVYQYLTMTSAELASATVGIQNQDKNDGLTVVYNSTYIHDSLAVAFSPPFLYPKVTPAEGVVPAGGFLDLDVEINSEGLLGGQYNSTIRMDTNDPVNAVISVPVDVRVIGIPDISVQPTALVFPTTFVGFNSTIALTVTNPGTDTLTITDIVTAGEFLASGYTLPVELRPGKSATFDVAFVPLDSGTRLGSLTLFSSDPDEGELVVPLQGEGLWPPEIQVTPPEIHTALPPGGSRHMTLNVANDGGSDLFWSAASNLISVQGGSAPGTYVELEKGEEDIRAGVLGSGGPDLFGYSWKDSDEPGGPVYDWVDISGVGSPAFGSTTYCDDCNSGEIPIGFNFPFYGNAFNGVRVVTNGWLSFTSTATTYTNQPLPNNGSAVPENLLALFWDDLVLRAGTGSEPEPSRVWYHNDGSRFIVQYQGMYRIANYTEPLDFQVILYPSGRIVYQYQRTTSVTLNSHTIGIQNQMRDDGLTVVFNDASYIHDNLAVAFETIPEWMKLSPLDGTVPMGGSQDVDVFLNAAGLEDGIHEGIIRVESNDPYTPYVEVPVTLNVSLIEPTMVEFVPKTLRLGDTSILRVRMRIELPPGLDPHDIRLSSVMLNDTVPALEDPAPYYTDDNRNGVEEVTFWFDYDLLSQTLAEGMLIPMTIMGEVEDVQWWRGTDYIRTGDPEQYMPFPGGYYVSGTTLPIQWTPASDSIDHRYSVLLSRDGGETWGTLVTGLEATTFDWTVTGAATENAIVRVVSFDTHGHELGSDETDAPFTLTGGALAVPLPIDPNEFFIERVGAQLQLSWKAPPTDLDHGPADRYRILRGTDPQNLVEVTIVTATDFSEELNLAEPLSIYRIVAANAAGDAR